MSDLSAAISEKRRREGISLREAGEASGVAFSTLARIEAGATPSLKVDRQIRHWLDGETATLPAPPMTLRDWFAGQALVSLGKHHIEDSNYVAEHAYVLADAMMALRKVQGNG